MLEKKRVIVKTHAGSIARLDVSCHAETAAISSSATFRLVTMVVITYLTENEDKRQAIVNYRRQQC